MRPVLRQTVCGAFKSPALRHRRQRFRFHVKPNHAGPVKAAPAIPPSPDCVALNITVTNPLWVFPCRPAAPKFRQKSNANTIFGVSDGSCGGRGVPVSRETASASDKELKQKVGPRILPGSHLLSLREVSP